MHLRYLHHFFARLLKCFDVKHRVNIENFASWIGEDVCIHGVFTFIHGGLGAVVCRGGQDPLFAIVRKGYRI